VHHGTRRLQEARFTNVVTRFFLQNCSQDELPQSFIVFAFLNLSVEIMLYVGK
jgi:hypothetical protein